MKFIYKIILLLVITITSSSNLHAYSYAAAGKEPTIDAKELIIKAININDFELAKNIFEKHKKNYKYLNDKFIKNLYIGLETSINTKDKKQIVKYLELSLGAELQRRIEGGLSNIKTFNIAKVMLVKANKFYKLLSSSLDVNTDKKLKIALKECMMAIGNPGLFGVGAKPINKKNYKKNQKIIIDIIQTL